MFEKIKILFKKIKILFKHYTKIKNYLINIKKQHNKIKKGTNNFFGSSKQEYKETIKMIKVFFSKKSTIEEINEAKKQFKDLLKISSLRPILILPGSPITLPLLYKIAKKFNIDLTPSSFKYNFLKVSIETNEKNLKIAKILLHNNLDITQRNFKLYKYFKQNKLEFNEENILFYNFKYNKKNDIISLNEVEILNYLNNLETNDDNIVKDIEFKFKKGKK